jgi:hypothetical protein
MISYSPLQFQVRLSSITTTQTHHSPAIHSDGHTPFVPLALTFAKRLQPESARDPHQENRTGRLYNRREFTSCKPDANLAGVQPVQIVVFTVRNLFSIDAISNFGRFLRFCEVHPSRTCSVRNKKEGPLITAGLFPFLATP